MENLVIPKSIAIILDGNGRWAERRNLPRAMGHKAGCEALEKTVEDCVRLGVECLTVYAFSTENWKRSAVEVSALMKLLRFYMVKLIDVANKNNVKAVMIGDESRFDPDIRKGIQKLVDATSKNTGMTFAFAINYGGRDEIKRAIEHIVDDARFGMFIHWGLYAIPARGEWVRSRERIKKEDYDYLMDEFSCENYNPKEWARLAKKAGMKYAVLTAKFTFCIKF